MIRKILGWTAALLFVLVLGFVVTVLLRWDRTFQAPLPDIHASADPDVIAAGRYLAYGPAHCANCHVPPELGPALERGEEPPLSGGGTFHPPPGTFHTPNLTPDRATGIGALGDGQLARVLRYGVRRDGRAAVPFMNYHQLSDADVTALISFLRSQPPVSHEVPPHDLNLLGKAVMCSRGERRRLPPLAQARVTLPKLKDLAGEGPDGDNGHPPPDGRSRVYS